MMLRVVTVLVSLAVHGGLAAFFMLSAALPTDEGALEAGSGDGTMVVEQAIALEGMSQGTHEASVEAVEAPPPVLQPVEPVEEVKPLEDVQHVVGSELGPEQENVLREEPPEEVKPVEEVEVKEVAALEMPPVVAVEEQQAAGKKQDGGEVTAFNAYRGKLFSHISRKKVNPRSRQSGKALVRVSIHPVTGALISHAIVQSSGSDVLDKAALNSVEKSAPFPPAPAILAEQAVFNFDVPFKFSVR